jgi:hypothetical protein
LVNSQAEQASGIGSMDQSQHGSRIVYPTLPATFTEGDIASLFNVSVDEKTWASTVARRAPSPLRSQSGGHLEYPKRGHFRHFAPKRNCYRLVKSTNG